MENAFTIAQVIVSILLATTILMQQRGAGLGGAIGGGSSEVYSSKRGAEKLIFNISVVLSVLFIGIGVVRLIVL